MLCFGGVKAWEGLRVMSKDACRPFSANRNGMVQGEGAAIFVLENFDNARKRGAEILAEVIGYAMSSDASDIVMPSKQGAARAIKGALIDAQLNSERCSILTRMALERLLMTKQNVPQLLMCLVSMPIT